MLFAIKTRLTMGRKSKASLAHLRNLGKNAQRSYQATVEDASNLDKEDQDHCPSSQKTEGARWPSNGEEWEAGLPDIQAKFIFLEDDVSDDSDMDSVDGDSELELDDDEAAEIRDDAALLAFSDVLQKAQEIAVTAERKKWGEKKRPHHYTKNSAHTLRRQSALRKRLTVSGQKSIAEWIKCKEKLNQLLGTETMGGNTAASHPEELDFVNNNAASTKVSNLFDRVRQALMKPLQTMLEHLQEEEEESSSESTTESLDTEMSDHDSGTAELGTELPKITDEHQRHVEELLEELRKGQTPTDGIEDLENTSDTALNILNYKDFPALRRARAKLGVKACDPKLDFIFRSRITSMVGTLNLYLDAELLYSWREASVVVTKSLGLGVQNGSKQARNIRSWIHQFLAFGKLPTHRWGQASTLILDHEDISQDIQLHLMEKAKKGFI